MQVDQTLSNQPSAVADCSTYVGTYSYVLYDVFPEQNSQKFSQRIRQLAIATSLYYRASTRLFVCLSVCLSGPALQDLFSALSFLGGNLLFPVGKKTRGVLDTQLAIAPCVDDSVYPTNKKYASNFNFISPHDTKSLAQQGRVGKSSTTIYPAGRAGRRRGKREREKEARKAR